MLKITPSKTVTPALELGEEVQIDIDVTSELENELTDISNTISAIDFNIFDSDDVSAPTLNGGVSHDSAGIISFGIIAAAVGKYKLEFIVTCNELLPDGVTSYEFIFYMWVKIKDI